MFDRLLAAFLCAWHRAYLRQVWVLCRQQIPQRHGKRHDVRCFRGRCAAVRMQVCDVCRSAMVRKLFLPRVRRAASTRPVAADVDPVPSFNDTSDQRVRPSLILSEIQQRSPKRDHDPRFHLSPCPPSTRNCPDAPSYCAAFTVLRPPLTPRQNTCHLARWCRAH